MASASFHDDAASSHYTPINKSDAQYVAKAHEIDLPEGNNQHNNLAKNSHNNHSNMMGNEFDE